MKSSGKQTVKAASCRRKNSKIAASSQLLVYSELLVYARGDRRSLKESDVLEEFRAVREDVLLLSLGSYFAELTELLTHEGEGQDSVLSLILNALYALGPLQKDPALVKAGFEIALLSEAGFAPFVQHCVVCGLAQPVRPQLHLREGGLHCRACRSQLGEGVSMPLTPAALEALRHFVMGSRQKLYALRLDDESMVTLAKAAEEFVHVQLDRGFCTLVYYKTLRQQLKLSR